LLILTAHRSSFGRQTQKARNGSVTREDKAEIEKAESRNLKATRPAFRRFLFLLSAFPISAFPLLHAAA
jgi:hypothetical protein